jgi:hypothetical protein
MVQRNGSFGEAMVRGELSIEQYVWTGDMKTFNVYLKDIGAISR